MTQGVDISYRINSGVKYTVSIPRAVQMLMYPGGGLSNRLILSQTSSYNASKMDFYQYRNTNDAAVHINDGRIYSSNGTQLFSNSKIQAVLIHEMLHGYGLKDLYNSSNRNSIMYGYVSGAATGLTSDANKVLNSKY